jgi:hypothetical protein
MTGMNVVGDRKRKNVLTSSSKISKGNEKSSGLFIAIYQSFEGSRRQKREWKILMATVKGMSMILGKIL